MQSWQDFISTQTPGPILDADCVISDLSHLGLIRIEGEDTRHFLQGQLTNDIQQVDAQTSQLSSYCNPKGRMLANFRLYQRVDALFMLLPRECLTSVLQRLRLFVLRSKVTLEDVTGQNAVIELAGECASGLITDAPTEDNAVVHQTELSIIRIPGDRLRLRIIGASDAVQAVWQQATGQAKPISQQAWRLLNIRAGLPTVYAATAEAFIPQMANMHRIGGVNFKKGCYTGQEVVARMQYLGKLKRRMYRVHINTAEMPPIGDDLLPKNTASTQSVGKIAEIAPVAQGGYEALIVGQIHSIEADDIRLGSMPDAEIRRLALPYAFE